LEDGLNALLKQSFSWWCVDGKGVSPEALLAGAVRIGYEGVDLIGEELWPVARDQGLSIVAIGGHGTLESGMNRRENSARIETELRTNLEKAQRWKIPVLICFSGNRNKFSGEGEGLGACAETLARMAPEAEAAGVTLAVELLNSRIDHPGYEADRTDWGVALCERVGSKAVTLLYDIYHMQIMEGDLTRTIERHHSHFSHYHTAGNPGRGPMNDDQEIHYPPIYRAIARTGYQGYVAHEFLPKADPLQELETAYRQVQEALKDVA
jgi:hydroxypyruvate isomerase